MPTPDSPLLKLCCYYLSWCPQLSCVQKCLVSTSVLCPQLFCVNKFLVFTSVLCPQVSCVHNCIVSTSVFCLKLSCVHNCLVSTSVLCPQVSCVQNCLVSTTALCSQLSCVHNCLVFTTVWCPQVSCVHNYLVSRWWRRGATPYRGRAAGRTWGTPPGRTPGAPVSWRRSHTGRGSATCEGHLQTGNKWHIQGEKLGHLQEKYHGHLCCGESDWQEGISNMWPGAGAVPQDTIDTSEMICDIRGHIQGHNCHQGFCRWRTQYSQRKVCPLGNMREVPLGKCVPEAMLTVLVGESWTGEQRKQTWKNLFFGESEFLGIQIYREKKRTK